MDAAAKLGRNPVSKHQVQPEYSMETSRLTRDGTAEPVSRDQILRHARGQGNINFPCSADHEQDWQPYPGPTRLIHTLLYVMTIHTYTCINRHAGTTTTKTWGLAKKGYTSLFLRQKGAHLKNMGSLYFQGAPICNTVLQHFSCNMVDAIRTTPHENLF